MDIETIKFIEAELLAVCPLPSEDQAFFRLQIKSDDGKSTKWINISPRQFKLIEDVLLGAL